MSIYRKNSCSACRSIALLMLSLLLLWTLSACDSDSADNVTILSVDSSDRLSDAELQRLQKKMQFSDGKEHSYRFGFDLRASAQEDTAQYLPFLKYLERATGYHFQLYFTPRSSSSADELGQNHAQFAAMGATSFLHAQARYGAISLVRGLNQFGKAEYQSVFVVAPDSNIRSIEDIRGQRLAFGARDSTQGHLIPRIMLANRGIGLDDLAAYSYTGSHQLCAEAVLSGKADVCGMQDQLAKKLAAEGLVKIIYFSRFYPSSGIVASQSVPDAVRAKVRQALLDFEPLGKDSKGLYHWDRTEMPRGFVASSDSDYVELRQWLIKLGFMQESATVDSET